MFLPIVYACTIATVHACTVPIFHVPFPIEIKFGHVEGGGGPGRSPLEKHGFCGRSAVVK